MAGSFAQFSRKLGAVARDVSDKSALTRLGVAAKADAAEAVKGDLGDLSMSNWRRGKPIQIGARFDVKGTTVDVMATPRSRGPWRVLESGRSAGVSKRRGRPVSASAGKGTWSDAVKLMEDRTPKRAADHVGKVLAKHLIRG